MKSTDKYVVALVLDPECGPKIRDLAHHFDLWAVPSVENRLAVEELWLEKEVGVLLREVTLWSESKDVSSEAMWLSMLSDLETHHGEHSQHPPVTTLEVVGAEATEIAVKALAEYGYASVEKTPLGFRASKGDLE